MRTHMKTAAWILAIALAPVAHGLEPAKLETLDQYTRIQIPVTSGSGFHLLTGTRGEVTLEVERIGSGALAALPQLSDARIDRVTVKTLGLDKAEVHVHFRDPDTESFAYNQGNNLVLDLWKGKAKAAAADHTDRSEANRSAPNARPAGQAATIRKVASAPAPFPAPAPRAEPLKMGRDLFHRFLLPMPELNVIAKDGGLDLPPRFKIEDRWKFAKGNLETEDGKGFEFAKHLFGAKKYGLCLKSIEITLRGHPKSEHREELEFLRALAYQKLGETTKAEELVNRSEKLLQELAERRNEKQETLPFSRLIVLYFAKEQLSHENWMAALRNLERVATDTKANDPDFPYVQMMLAEVYGKVDQPRQAERIYRFLTEKFPKHQLAREAFYRITDLLAVEKNYARVTEEGEAALRAYPDYERTRAEALFNIGEAYFWRGQYAKAEKYLRHFTEIASAHTIASLAWVRLGEIEEVAKGNLVAAHADYLRAKNGYPFSRGDLVASVRLARLDLPIEKDPRFVVRNLEELLNDKTVDWDLKRMAELTFIDYLYLAGDTQRGIDLASAGMAQTDGVVYALYLRAYQKGLFSRFEILANEKKYAEALSLYDREQKWLEGYGPDTFRVAASVYRGLGLFASSNKLMERYSSELAKSGRHVSSLERVSAVGRERAENSFARGSYEDTLTAIENTHDARSEYLRAISLFRLGRKSAAYAAADHAVPMFAAAKKGYSDDDVENLAEIQIERDAAERDFPRMEREIRVIQSLCAKESERLTFAAADALWYQKRHAYAEKAYREALAKYPSGMRSDRARYNLGMSLLAQGKRDAAVKLMTELQNSGQGVWSASAKEELELIEWEKKYSSVLRTLPPNGLGIAN